MAGNGREVLRLPGATNRRWIITKAPSSQSVADCLRLESGTIPTPGPGEMLVRNLWLSLDPTGVLTMAGYAAEPPGPSGGPVMRGLAVSRVITSQLAEFQPGDIVHSISGWEDYSVTDGTGFYPAWKVPEGATPAEALGVFGATGMAAYWGMTEVGRPRGGETVVVSGAAGGVGSIAAQIARIRGSRVVGIAGGRAKGSWLLEQARIAAVIDHRSEDVAARLDALCPDGIDLFFDTVGGPTLDLALERLRIQGRVVICGGTSRYGATPRLPGPANYLALSMTRGRMEGLLALAYLDRYPEAQRQLRSWIREGELRTIEDVTEGLEHAPEALDRMFRGENLGKQLLRISDQSG
jgi:NADPH-dependent curcumin reductase CurA